MLAANSLQFSVALSRGGGMLKDILKVEGSGGYVFTECMKNSFGDMS